MQLTGEDIQKKQVISEIKRLYKDAKPQLYINRNTVVFVLAIMIISVVGLGYSIYELNQVVTGLQQAIPAK